MQYTAKTIEDREFWGPLLLWVSENCPVSDTDESKYLQGYHGCLRGQLDDAISHILFHNLGCSRQEYGEWEAEAKEGCVIWGQLREKDSDSCLWEALPKLRK